MKRRTFLAAPRRRRSLDPPSPPASKPLVFVPQSNLTVLDPVSTAATVTRNYSLMVYETLYARDMSYRPRPQMVAGDVIEDDGKRWTMTLRDGLLFHDGTPVRAQDCVASLQRWLKRDQISTTSSRGSPRSRRRTIATIVWRLHKPFPTLPYFLSKAQPQPVIMPERLAMTDPFSR